MRATHRSPQAVALARPAARIVSWQPLSRMMAAGVALVLVGSRGGAHVRLSIASAAVAASTAFLLDDPAAETLAPSPTSLPVRRVRLAVVAAVAVAAWWAVAASIATQRGGAFPLRGWALQLAVFVAIALAASATAARMGDRTSGGIAGAAVTAICFASTFLPPRPWLPFPAHPDAPGATIRLVSILAVALAALAWASRDPAHQGRSRHTRWRRTT